MNTQKPSKSLTILLLVENDPELIEFQCNVTGLPIWPLIRTQVLRTIMSDWLYNSKATASSSINFINFAKNAMISSLHNMNYRIDPQRNILIQNTGLGNYKRDRLVHDRFADYFIKALPFNSLVYQDKPKESISQKYSFDPVLHKSPRNILNKIYSKLMINDTHKKLAHMVVNRVKENASVKLGYEFDEKKIETLINSLAGYLAALPYAVYGYADWFSKHKFKLLLKEDACYGGSGIYIIHAARLNGIVVAEYQHGAISKGHDGYNVSDELVSSSLFRKVLPDYLLTYGKWWSAQTNMPINKIAIGNPHLTEMIGATSIGLIKKNQLLVLGDGIETELYLELASKVFRIIGGKGMNVVFRPHPFERERIKSFALPSGVQLDSNTDIYSSLKQSRVVISELSTGLFEAVGLVDQILLWKTDKSMFAFPEIPFVSFSSIDELESLLNDKSLFDEVYKTIPSHELWEPNWRQNYLSFVEGVVGQ